MVQGSVFGDALVALEEYQERMVRPSRDRIVFTLENSCRSPP